MIVRQTAQGIEVLAPAKLNLFLEVLGKRPDGYHELETLMVTLDLHDTLRFSDDPSGQITLECDDPALPLNRDNLVVQAAERLKEALGADRGAKIDLRKVIPSQAGLAGGSSDAAATLVGLDRLWRLESSPRQLESLAAEIGSDVAFFLKGPAAVCRGRGERVESIELPQKLWFVLVCPALGVSTADVYRKLVPPEMPRSIEPILESFHQRDTAALGRGLFNRLQPVAEAIEPGLTPIHAALQRLGPALEGHLMSGSGSAFFGLCRNEGAAGHAAQFLEGLGLGRVQVVTCGP